MSVPRLLVCGTAPGVGKSTVSLGLIYELRRAGRGVSVCQTKPNTAQASLLRRISNRYVRCLDPQILSSAQILDSVSQAGIGSDLVLIDGHAGLFDGIGAGARRGSDSEIAALTRSPIVLVVDAERYGASVAAVIKGFQHFSAGFDTIGTIMNRVERGDPHFNISLRDRDFFESAMHEFQLPPLLGGIPEATFDFAELSSGVTEDKGAVAVPRQFFADLSALMVSGVSVNEILVRAAKAPALPQGNILSRPTASRARIAVSDDPCFSAGFQDNLEWLRFWGAELVPFSPIADRALPERLQGIYIGGGSLREYGKEISANSSLRESIKNLIRSGVPTYAEGGGAAFLCNEFQVDSDGSMVPGVGVLDDSAATRIESPDYCEASFLQDTFLGGPGQLMKGVTTNGWQLARDNLVAKKIRLQSRGRAAQEGFSPGENVFMTFHFWHFGSNPSLANSFVETAAGIKPL